jgi:phosphoglycolate phosphatase-like HAD superfamily hydrolase
VDKTEREIQALLATIISASSSGAWLADVDDTLTDTIQMHEAASFSILEILETSVGMTKAVEIVSRFKEIFQSLLTSHQSSSGSVENAHESRIVQASLLARVNKYQLEVKQQWGATKKFSREVLLRLAGEDCGVLLNSEQIEQCVDRYWQQVEDNPIFFADAIRMSENLKRAGIPLFLFTSSDGRMTLKANGYFHYNPELSLKFKIRRMERLRAKGLYYREAFVGDPIDKPTPEFFGQVYSGIERALGRQVNPESLIVLGDSYESDLAFPVTEWGVKLGILYRRGREGVIMDSEKIISVGTWDVINEVL